MPWLCTTSTSKRHVAFLCSVLALVPVLLGALGHAAPSAPRLPRLELRVDLLRAAQTCQGVQVHPSTDLQARIDAKPPRTTFCLAKGLYLLSGTIWTKRKFPTLDLRAGAVIDGQNGGFIGINGPDGPADKPGTRILGGIFQHFGNADAPIWVQPLVAGRNSVVKGTEFRENFNMGLTVQGDNARVVHVYTHHNGRYGLNVTPACAGCPGPVGVVIEDSEIAFNNTWSLPTDNDAGGTKFAGGTDGMIVRRNEVHDNYGSGLWWDGYNRNAQVYGNVIYDNRNWGIFYELSLGGTRIHHNTLRGNGTGDGTANWFNNVQLLVSCSDGSVGGIKIYDNRIDGTAYPLGLINHSYHPLLTRGVYVHHNVMTLRSSETRVGAVAFDGLTELFTTAAHNRFDHNTYRVPDTRGAYWAWDGQTLTWSQWQAAGNDVNGALEVAA